MHTEYDFSQGQIQGKRERQEDSYQILQQVEVAGETGLLFLLCDGMGGHVGGEVASHLICEHFRESFDQSALAMQARLKSALDHAHQQLIAYTEQHAEYAGMGTTLIAACVVGQRLYWLSVGDSPFWILREGKLQRLNADHSMLPVFKKMVEMGELSLEEALNDPRRHALRSVISRKPIKEVDVTETAFVLQAGDQLVLASDGLETLTDEQIIAALLNASSLNCQQVVTELLTKVDSIARPDQDNTSVIVYKAPIELEKKQEIEPLKTLPLESSTAKKKSKYALLALLGAFTGGILFLAYTFLPSSKSVYSDVVYPVVFSCEDKPIALTLLSVQQKNILQPRLKVVSVFQQQQLQEQESMHSHFIGTRLYLCSECRAGIPILDTIATDATKKELIL
ncbi:MAG: SpoIIE family protein phosphatase [Methyloprofundus sp.]|nr:SpoIIE family protein phosphatase [Methyloprofundus sp.]